MDYNIIMTRQAIEVYKTRICESLKCTNPYRIILFGSIASGSYNDDSDFDIAIILDYPLTPKNYEEKLDMKMSVRKALGNLSFEIPIDLIVYTMGEFETIKSLNTSFYKELEETGEILYEKAG
jgi:predicted nucleotidyltransferase